MAAVVAPTVVVAAVVAPTAVVAAAATLVRADALLNPVTLRSAKASGCDSRGEAAG